MMKDRHGFTLVELLAVIVILGSISIVTVMGISASLERQEQSEICSQIEIVKNDAKIWFSLNSGSSVTLAKLKSDGYIDNQKITKLNGGTVVISSNNYVYKKDTNISNIDTYYNTNCK